MPDGKEWLAENLDYPFCIQENNFNIEELRCCYFSNNEATYGIDGTRKCGLLYNWYAVKFLIDYSKYLIPGWHVPTKEEWDELATAVGGSDVAGTKLKSLDNVSTDRAWPTSWNGTDDYGFNALPSGAFEPGQYFTHLGVYSIFWTSTKYNETHNYRCYLSKDTELITFDTRNKNNFYSVRLIKDN